MKKRLKLEKKYDLGKITRNNLILWNVTPQRYPNIAIRKDLNK